MSESAERPETPPSAAHGATRSRLIALGVLAALVPAVFAAITNNIWEDFFITFRCSLNLVEGNGLVYEAGRTVHAFTSPLGVLVPAGISWILGTADPQVVMEAFRLFACACLAAAWLMAASRLNGLVAVAAAAGFWLLDPKLAAFSTNGMETGLMILFVVWVWRALLDGRGWEAGVAFGGAMWTRPDGFVFVGAIMVGVLLFPGARRMALKEWLWMFGVAALVYTPWFAWAWAYYGSPVPNTILAKGGNLLQADTFRNIALYPIHFLFGRSAAQTAFLPPYYFLGGWPDVTWWFGRVLSFGVLATALWPACGRGSRVAAVAFLLGGAYLTVAPPAPWYLPAWQVLAYLALGGLFAAVWAQAKAVRWRQVLAGAGLAVTVGFQAWLFVSVTYQLKVQQELIEFGIRRNVGTDLRNWASSPQDTVFLEPLGYIGFFSGLSMRDTPGLCAPEVVALRRSGHTSMGALVDRLAPDWAVVRGLEFEWMKPEDRQLLQDRYALVAIYDVQDHVRSMRWLPGRGFLLFDAHFSVWRRRVP